MIEVQHLSKSYGRVTAVDDISFRVERGEILGFLGPNGAGKTTTMRILTGYMPATHGKAIVANFDVFEQPLEAKQRTGYLPETPPLYPDMTVLEYLTFVAKIKGVAAPDRHQRIRQVMERTRIADMANRLCSKLSKGYRQRVGLAQALIHNPDVLILDEPTAGLDPQQINETRQLIKELAGDHTIILSTHILPEVSQTCQRVVIINKGKVVTIDTPDNLTARLQRLGHDVRAGRHRGIGPDAHADADSGRDAGGGIRSSRRPGRLRSGQRVGPRRPSRPRARDRQRRLGPRRAAADAREPRGRLPDADRRNRGVCGGGNPEAPGTTSGETVNA